MEGNNKLSICLSQMIAIVQKYLDETMFSESEKGQNKVTSVAYSNGTCSSSITFEISLATTKEGESK